LLFSFFITQILGIEMDWFYWLYPKPASPDSSGIAALGLAFPPVKKTGGMRQQQ